MLSTNPTPSTNVLHKRHIQLQGFHFLIFNLNSFMMASNLTGSFKDLKTYDFQTLYTKIPQDKLKENLGQFIKEAFQIKECKYINILEQSCCIFKH